MSNFFPEVSPVKYCVLKIKDLFICSEEDMSSPPLSQLSLGVIIQCIGSWFWALTQRPQGPLAVLLVPHGAHCQSEASPHSG